MLVSVVAFSYFGSLGVVKETRSLIVFAIIFGCLVSLYLMLDEQRLQESGVGGILLIFVSASTPLCVVAVISGYVNSLNGTRRSSALLVPMLGGFACILPVLLLLFVIRCHALRVCT